MRKLSFALVAMLFMMAVVGCKKDKEYDGIKKDDRIEDFAAEAVGSFQGQIDLYEGLQGAQPTPVAFDITKVDEKTGNLTITGQLNGEAIKLQFVQQFEVDGVHYISLNVEDQTIGSENVSGQEKDLHGKTVHGVVNTTDHSVELYFNSEAQGDTWKFKLTGTRR